MYDALAQQKALRPSLIEAEYFQPKGYPLCILTENIGCNG